MALEIGSYKSEILKQLNDNNNRIETIGGIETLIQCDTIDNDNNNKNNYANNNSDSNSNNNNNSNSNKIESKYFQLKDENIDFGETKFDLVLSSHYLHW